MKTNKISISGIVQRILTGKITREHQIEEHFFEYLRNLVELPEERAYLRKLLDKLDIHEATSSAQVAGEK